MTGAGIGVGEGERAGERAGERGVSSRPKRSSSSNDSYESSPL